MADKEQHPTQISLESCIIRKIDNTAKVSKERSIGTDMIISFDFMESILSPFVSGALLISDSKDFINTFPLEGGEEVELSNLNNFSIRFVNKRTQGVVMAPFNEMPTEFCIS